MPGSNRRRHILVGVSPRHPEAVVHEAARFARAFGADLVCAHVDPSRYVVQEHPDGSVEARPLDPDVQEWTDARFDDELAARLTRRAAELEVPIQFRELAGDVSRSLIRLADVLGAELIVVGSRSGRRLSVREFFGGSVAVQLAHRQPRPVVVVPLTPRADGPLPWEEQV